MSGKLENMEWKEFFIEDVVKILSGKDMYKAERIKGITPYISATANNNGIGHFVSNDNNTKESGCLSVNRNGSVGYSFYHPYDALFSNDCRKLRLRQPSKFVGIFISQQITKQKAKYGYGYKMGTGRLKRQKILLPSTIIGEPDYSFMADYIRDNIQEKIKTYKTYISKRIGELKGTENVLALSEKDWKEFFLSEVFSEIQRGKRFKKSDHKAGKMPYVSSTALSNGVDNYVSNKENVRIFSDCLSLANSGSVGACFYQPYSFVASDHVTKLKNKDFNKNIFLFIATIVSRLGEKYSFNREINDPRIKREKILLPINRNKEPDYNYMGNYMKRLELKKLKDYLNYKGQI